jgi:hypothetical protein
LKFHFGNVPGEQKEPSVEEGWYRIHSPSSRLGYALAGLIGLVFPNVLCAWLIAVSVLTAQNEVGEVGVEPSVPWGVVILALLLFIPVHELVHAMWHPRLGLSPQTVMVIWPTKLRFGVYYEGCMTRGRWLMMRLAPLVCLSVIPLGLLTLFKYVPASFALETFLQVLMLVNGIGSGGDLLAVIWVVFQVPTKAQICFCGGKAYWRSVSPSGQVVLPSA